MKKLLILTILIVMANVIKAEVLPQPQHSDNGMSLDEALRLRRSDRDFDPARDLSAQQLSDLLWAAVGVNRPDKDKLTSPTALNRQEISVYVFSKSGVSLYDARKNTLTKMADGDHRMLTASRGGFTQDFVMEAPVMLVIVADVAKFEAPAEMATLMGAVDAGIVSQNINLFCAAAGLATVTRATMDAQAISSLLGLTPGQMPVLNNPVGYKR